MQRTTATLTLTLLLTASASTVASPESDGGTADDIILSAGGALSLRLSPSTLAYRVYVGPGTRPSESEGRSEGEPEAEAAWFDSGAGAADGGYSFSTGGAVHSLDRKGLSPLGPPARGRGTDAAGAFTSVAIHFAAAGTTEAEWVATFKAYAERPAIVFAQKWLKAVPAALGGSTFPSLHVGAAAAASARQLGTLEYTGASCGFMVGAQGEFPGIKGGPDKGYIVIAPRDAAGAGASATLAIGPVTEHFANQARNQNSSLVYGLAPTFETVPAGYELETVLVASTAVRQAAAPRATAPARASIPSGGVNGALMEFGDFLLAKHNKTRAQGDHKPETQYIGYSTTAYYFCECLAHSRIGICHNNTH